MLSSDHSLCFAMVIGLHQTPSYSINAIEDVEANEMMKTLEPTTLMCKLRKCIHRTELFHEYLNLTLLYLIDRGNVWWSEVLR